MKQIIECVVPPGKCLNIWFMRWAMCETHGRFEWQPVPDGTDPTSRKVKHLENDTCQPVKVTTELDLPDDQCVYVTNETDESAEAIADESSSLDEELVGVEVAPSSRIQRYRNRHKKPN